MDLFVVFGGQSPEHDVSVQSAANVLRHADQQQYRPFAVHIDRVGDWAVLPAAEALTGPLTTARLAEWPHLPAAVAIGRCLATPSDKVVFPLIHGRGGEDGALQGLCEWLQLPYVGCGVTSSAIGMDKAVMKQLMAALGIPVAPFVCLRADEYQQRSQLLQRQLLQQLSLPCFVKPAHGGSSLGISRVTHPRELGDALLLALAADSKVLVEQEIIGREIEIGLLGGTRAQCSLPGEFVRAPSFFDYSCKYLDEGLQMRVPATVSSGALQQMYQHASTVWREFDCHGLCRADFFLTADDQVYFNEINTLPGFTQYSMYPRLWQVAGLELSGLIDRLVELALDKQTRVLPEKGAVAGD